jgi:hypothetical protein
MFCYPISCNFKFIGIKLYTMSCYTLKGAASLECSPFHSWFWIFVPILAVLFLSLFVLPFTHTCTDIYVLNMYIWYFIYFNVLHIVWMCAFVCGGVCVRFLRGLLSGEGFVSRKLVYTVNYYMLSEVCRGWIVSCTVLLMGSLWLSLHESKFCFGKLPKHLYVLFFHARYIKIVKITC